MLGKIVAIIVRYTMLWLPLGIFTFALWYVYARGVDQNWDLLNYHYFAGYSLLHWRYAADIAAAGLQTFQSPISNILSYVTLSSYQFPLSAWIIASVQLTAIPLVVLIARQVGFGLGYKERNWAEVIALFLCFLAPLWWSELGTSFADASIGPIALLGLYLCGIYISGSYKKKYIIFLAGLCFGFVVGLKLTNAIFLIAVLLAIFVVTAIKRPLLRLMEFGWLFGGIAVGFAFLAWWNIYLYINWKSPVFPFYNALFESPYFDLYNWRDLRWRFGSLSEFFLYIYDAAFGTSKTSEISFADARLLIVGILIPMAIISRRLVTNGSDLVAFFLIFFGVSFALWSILFAYERYLIPIELLFGVVIWILCRSIWNRESFVLAFLFSFFVVSFVQFKVPDWGHRLQSEKKGNVFGVEVPMSIATSPARYLVVGAPVSYILPFLHPESHFFGLGVSHQIDEFIKISLLNESALPLRILAKENNFFDFWKIFSSYNISSENSALNCKHFRSAVDWYVVCEVESLSVETSTVSSNRAVRIDLDFTGLNSVLPDQVLGIVGLSNREEWGRWSDDDQIVILFGKCISSKKIKVTISGQAYGPNIGRKFRLFLGKGNADVVFGETTSRQDFYIEPGEGCHKEFRLTIPKKTSPVEFEKGLDARQLGVKLDALIFEFN